MLHSTPMHTCSANAKATPNNALADTQEEVTSKVLGKFAMLLLTNNTNAHMFCTCQV